MRRLFGDTSTISSPGRGAPSFAFNALNTAVATGGLPVALAHVKSLRGPYVTGACWTRQITAACGEGDETPRQ